MSLRSVSAASRSLVWTMPALEWRSFDACYPAPTFFARPAWSAALEHVNPSFGAEPAVIALPGGAEVLIPLVRMRGSALRWNSFVGMPTGSYTVALREDGSLASSSDTNAAIRAFAERRCDRLSLTLWPLAPQDLEYRKTRHQAAVIDLRDGLEAALARFRGVTRRMAGQAERRGVTCARESGEGVVDLYYQLLLDSAKRWGVYAPTISKKQLEAVVHFGGYDVEVWFARYDGEAIAGGVMLYGSQEAFFWTASMRAEYATLRPSNALNVALMARAIERGVQWYNMGASEGLPGVEKFKESLGAVPIDYFEFELESRAYRTYSVVRNAVTSLTRR